MSSLAIMQPYFLPYIGYFQLISAVDKFVIYDDVNYIRQGWVNRNRILLQGHAHMLSLPVAKASSYCKISELHLVSNNWRDCMLSTIHHAYVRAPCFSEVMPLVEKMIGYPANALNDFLLHSLKQLCGYLLITTPIVQTSSCYGNAHLKGQERLIDICQLEGATQYVNSSGGMSLYSQQAFARYGIDLHFLRPEAIYYSQLGAGFVANLSMLDVLMFNCRSQVRTMMKQFLLRRSDS